MAYRVQTQAELNFGTVAGASDVVVTHVRIRQEDDTEPVVKQLGSSVTFETGDPMTIPSGMLDLVYPAGDFTNDHMAAVVNPYYSGQTFEIDLMTSSSAVVADTGYSQQTYSNWAFSTESD